jgi:hypothetical protein
MICPACNEDIHPAQTLTVNGLIDICPGCGHKLGTVDTPMPAHAQGRVVTLKGEPQTPPPLGPSRQPQPAPNAPQAHPGQSVSEQVLAALATLLGQQVAAPPPAAAPQRPAASIRDQAVARLAEVEAELEAMDALVAERNELRAMLAPPTTYRRHISPAAIAVATDANLRDEPAPPQVEVAETLAEIDEAAE